MTEEDPELRWIDQIKKDIEIEGKLGKKTKWEYRNSWRFLCNLPISLEMRRMIILNIGIKRKDSSYQLIAEVSW